MGLHIMLMAIFRGCSYAEPGGFSDTSGFYCGGSSAAAGSAVCDWGERRLQKYKAGASEGDG